MIIAFNFVRAETEMRPWSQVDLAERAGIPSKGGAGAAGGVQRFRREKVQSPGNFRFVQASDPGSR
jgi:hypothetical protein